MKKINIFSTISFATVSTALVLVVFILVSFSFLPKRLPLFYSLPWGEEQLSTPQQLLIIPSLIICITLINIVLSWQLHKSQYFFKLILSFTAVISSVLLLVSLLKIFFLFI